MANFTFRFSVLIICVLLVKVLQSREVGRARKVCGDCLDGLDVTYETVARNLAAHSSRFGANSEWALEDNRREQSDEDFPLSNFRNSGSQSTSADCHACWVLIEHLVHKPETSNEREITDGFTQFSKKTLLNNGWL